ncbi:MAG: HDIG domain-containing protein, partial [Syntrophomonadaceae bacterium]|nr:HDIG domain-containing protein [Syntrophomonadaceae bacterium]
MLRDEALTLLKDYLHDENHIKHSLAVEAIMRGVAAHLGEDVEKYGLTGLLHDIDYNMTGEEPFKHSLLGAEILEKQGLPEDLV